MYTQYSLSTLFEVNVYVPSLLLRYIFRVRFQVYSLQSQNITFLIFLCKEQFSKAIFLCKEEVSQVIFLRNEPV